MPEELEQMPILWWKDKKLLTGVVLVIISFILGVYGKIIIIAKFYEPVQLITGISIYVFSFILLFLGAFLVGWETTKLIHQRIHHHVKQTVKTTYHHAKGFPKKSYHYTKGLHRKGMDKIAQTSKIIVDKIKQ